MTENERQEILNDIKDGYIDAWDNLTIDELFKQIEKEHEEIQQYRAIGLTPKMVKEMIESEKQASIQAIFRGAELELYQAIGTIEEFKALKEKATPKKGIPYTSSNNHKFVECPSCHKDMDLYYDFCQHCGQSVDWGKSKT